LAQALDNPFLRTTGMIRVVSHPAKPDLRVLANPIKIDGQRLDQAVCSQVGADNETYVADMRTAERAGSP
jgi:crotonobetainyl-CoA:carnitine CoA-transferase CaiB-like acyl-CoA transferase